MADILVVEDMVEIGEMLHDFLAAEGYDVYHAASGEEALEIYASEGAKLLILDIMLPGIDGFSLCKRIRQNANTPIIIISARTNKDDKLNGLILGADDYIEKPFDIDLLIAKIHGIMKRRYATDEIIDGDIRLDKNSRKVYLKGEEVAMRAKEFDLLLYMMENKGKALKKEDLFNKIWGFESDSEPQTLNVHIKYLRDKLEEDSKKPVHIQTVWGIGYRYE
ncbi:MAG: response regulator transcription factor [Coprococcus sp.]|nr:response regulator transcription factor [Coprococcus sp.]